jgi:hypothetical protein
MTSTSYVDEGSGVGPIPKTFLPNLRSDYTGRRPLQLSPTNQMLLNALIQRGGGEMIDPQ